MKLPRDIIFYTLFGIILLLIGIAAQNLYSINQTLDLTNKQINIPSANSAIMLSSKEGNKVE